MIETTPTDSPTEPGWPVRAVTPYLVVSGADRAIAFYAAAFGAIERERRTAPDGRITHAELALGGGSLFVADAHPELARAVGRPARAPEAPEAGAADASAPQAAATAAPCVYLELDVDDVEAVVSRATGAGARVARPADHPETGLQSAALVDPFGHVWLVTHAVEGDAA